MQHEYKVCVALSESAYKNYLQPLANITLLRYFWRTVKLDFIGNGE